MTLPELNLVVTIDAEEDNWGYEARESSVENIKMVPRLQTLFDRYRVKPSYMVSYQVASCDWAVGILSDILSRGCCEIGAHLHPWNTPPVKEEINERNSMMKNLPYDLQVEKIDTLTDKIEKAFEKRPLSFRAGRWGLGQNTVKALISLGYLVDTSVTPTLSWKNNADGPEYRNVKTGPFWISTDVNEYGNNNLNAILEVPVTIGFNRWPFEFWQKIYSQIQKDWLQILHPIGVMNRTGLLKKIWLSPEGQSAEDMIALMKIMISNGMKTLNMSFHTTSLLPGKSPFVRDAKELEQFYSKIQAVLEYLSVSTNMTSLTLSTVARHADLIETGQQSAM